MRFISIIFPYIKHVIKEYYCHVCDEERDQKDHVYYCTECQGLFVAHINCVLTWVSSSLWFSMYKLPVFIDFF